MNIFLQCLSINRKVLGLETRDFLGFTITTDGVKTTQKFIQSIKDFPETKTLTDLRSWFGLINQVSYAFATAPQMAPFRILQYIQIPIQWPPELAPAVHQWSEKLSTQCPYRLSEQLFQISRWSMAHAKML